MPSLIERIRTSLDRPIAPKLRGDQDFGEHGTHPPAGLLVPAAVLVPIIPAPQPKLLLTTRTPHLRSHAGQVAFPGGRIDDTDDGPVMAALREAEEEVGLPPASVQVLGLSDPYRTGTGYEVRPVVGLLPETLDLKANPAEVADVFQVPLEYVLDPANHHLREAEWQGRMRRYYSIEWDGRLIWGATAGMLVNLAGRLA
ncbi:CoA pyrophosphatase [Sandaracinobacter sp. RS1-74]|uniref:CoA pyrophosphatase n=1 Tax=Sandaracinobacteroides sayramensis TaxID=2913411 RepID=UPI001EDBC159|nr:CoA pyrophosphatase [Sandaracinobacteroides sayramensis]MCG2841518.1 CoA pyrophosphatase [Sandaracinobacteroides sayramensis]